MEHLHSEVAHVLLSHATLVPLAALVTDGAYEFLHIEHISGFPSEFLRHETAPAMDTSRVHAAAVDDGEKESLARSQNSLGRSMW